MNTTALITHWSMEGTMRDLLKRSAPVDDDPAPVAPSEQAVEVEVVPGEAPPEPDYVLVKRPDDDEWRPLVADD